MTLEALLQEHISYHPAPNLALIKKAYALAEAAHLHQLRDNDQPYIQHCLAVAEILLELKVDSYTLAAALTHDVLERTNLPKEELVKELGEIVGELVDGVSDVKSLTIKTEGRGEHVSNLTKLLLATAKDVRVVMIRLAEKLHNLQTLEGLPEEKRRKTLEKALYIYSPLADRVGVSYIKRQLDDLAFKELDPISYRRIREHYQKSSLADPEKLTIISRELGDCLLTGGLQPSAIFGRLKQPYSLYKKLERYYREGKTNNLWSLEKIHDQLAFMVLVETVEECYLALDLLRRQWPLLDASEVVERPFKDYISHPKPNGYRALHILARGEAELSFEIQIRTREMHDYNEFGPANHIFYKEEGSQKAAPVERISWLKDLLKWREEITEAEELDEALRVDVFGERIFVFTPKGDVVDLPLGATPIDFAYALHSDLGSYCQGASVNGRLVPLSTKLTNGDQVEIKVSRQIKGPSRDWLGFVVTPKARAKIRQKIKAG